MVKKVGTFIQLFCQWSPLITCACVRQLSYKCFKKIFPANFLLAVVCTTIFKLIGWLELPVPFYVYAWSVTLRRSIAGGRCSMQYLMREHFHCTACVPQVFSETTFDLQASPICISVCVLVFSTPFWCIRTPLPLSIVYSCSSVLRTMDSPFSSLVLPVVSLPNCPT